MGISVKSVFDDVQDQIGKENGAVLMSQFNRLSKRAENRLLGWITGNVEGNALPQMYTTQKDKDFVSPFITDYKNMLVDGKLTKPDDYYLYENSFGLSLEDMQCEGEEDETDCEDDDSGKNKVLSNQVTLLNGDEFNIRKKTRIKGLKPSFEKPIAKEVGNYFEFAPDELPAVVLEYVRYPVYANIVSKIDATYNEEVIDEALSTNYEWKEYARDMLVYLIVDFYTNTTRDGDLKNMNAATGGQGR